ncbi:MAG: biotin--[acetyl-CoA-carboxylase] ligase [Propionibacteriaceae bacterium]|jgi:BirA family biotin operon repressor/biotin-[acetyl-CoA-carboxylase] ligase|nr:biotin--[acetyl-CoA-carboxylase] ligase [Propionibacteriaceae bacterium]
MPQLPAADAARIAAYLGADTGFAPINVVAETGSTNTDLLRAIVAGEASPGAVLIAEHQTSGRGRFTREWLDTPGTNIAMSILVKPKRPMTQWGWLSLLSGMAVTTALRSLDATQAFRVELKWPNDVLIDTRKVCGIIADGNGEYAVIGIGVNVGQQLEELPLPSATSLALAGLPTDKSLIIARILTSFAQYFEQWQLTGDIRTEYLALSATIGRSVRVILSDTESCEGEAVAIAGDGALVVSRAGVPTPFAAGDVVHLR